MVGMPLEGQGMPTGETKKARIRALLKGIETGDPASVEVIHPKKYIQHNPQTQTGREGLAALFKRLSHSAPRVNLVRVFSDANYVFAHTEYDFASRRIGFEVFRFEGEYAVEHWDNIQPRQGPNPSGHTMVDGPAVVSDLSQTEPNRALVRSFVSEVLVERQIDRLDKFLNANGFTQHNPGLEDGLEAVKSALEKTFADGYVVSYTKLHRVLAEGDFALAVSEGYQQGAHCAFYDLFRIADRKIVEHWDTIEAVAPKHEWKHNNGKF